MRSPDPIPALKQQVAAELTALMDGWNADDVAGKIGTDRPRISEIRRGKLDRFSLETLIRYVCCFRQRVELRVVPIPPHRPKWPFPPKREAEPDPDPNEPAAQRPLDPDDSDDPADWPPGAAWGSQQESG